MYENEDQMGFLVRSLCQVPPSLPYQRDCIGLFGDITCLKVTPYGIIVEIRPKNTYNNKKLQLQGDMT